MKIIYSPFYDQGTYTAQTVGKARLGERILGTRGLLGELELRAGMTHRRTSDFERIVAYYEAIKSVLKDGSHPFYEESFSKDELGVSGELLRWRDALVMAGWTKDITGNAPEAYKFNDLARIEKYFSKPGESDRWQELRKAKGELTGYDVEVRVPKKSLEKVIADVLDASGAKVKYADDVKGEELKLAASIDVIEFRNRVEAYRWASGQNFSEGTLLINQDNKAFNDVLRAMGKPLAKSEYTDSNPLTMQLFKLGFGLFDKVVDVKTLVSYLNIPVHPLPYETRKALLAQLTDEGGYGRGWDELLNKYNVCSHPLVVAPNPPEKAATQAIQSFSDELKGWSLRYAGVLAQKEENLNLANQLMAIFEMCEALDTVLETAPDAIEYETLRRWVDGIYCACSFPADAAQIGCADIIRDVKAIVEGPDNLVWLDCNATGHSKYPLFFLSTAEIDFLKASGLRIVSEETFTKTASLAAKKALGLVKKNITLVISRKAYGSRVDEHPIFTEIKAKKMSYKCVEDPAMPCGEQLRVEKLTAPSEEFALEGGVELPERSHGESYSSLDTLIQRPIDYVLDHVTYLRERDLSQVADIRTIKGNVAHAVIENLVGVAKAENRTSFSEIEIEKIIDEETLHSGVLLANSKIEFDSFKLKLTQSVKSLFGAFTEHKLKVFDSEHYVEVMLPEDVDGQTIGKFNARIDLILQDVAGDFVIIDLKWSESRRFKDKIANQTDLQLVLYEKALKAAYPDKRVLGCGYYVIPQCKIETRSRFFEGWEIAGCNIPDEECDVYGEATRSFFFRKDQLKRGVLEGAEGQSFDPATMEYIKAMSEDGIDLYPLDTDYNDENLKAAAYGDKNYILKERAI